MTSTRKFVLGILCVASVGGVGLLQSACDLISHDGSGQTETLQMLLTDAPFPFDVISEASVTITRIEVRQSSSETEGTGEQLSECAADSDDEDGNDINYASQIQSFLFEPSQSIRILEVDITGSISGVVMGDSGNPLAHVAVTVSTGGVAVTRSATTDASSFMLSGMEPGSYDITLSGTGFTDQTVTDVEVSAGTDAVLSDKTLTTGTGST